MTGSVSDLQDHATPPTFTLVVTPPSTVFQVTLGPGVTLPSGIKNGSQVVVKTASSDSSNNEIIASAVTLEEPDDNEHEVEVKGVVTSGNAASFMIGSQAVVTSTATEFHDGTAANVVPGARVDVEGTVDAQGVLHADKVEFEEQQEQQEVEVKGVITSGNATSFMIGSQTVVTSTATEFHDGTAANVVPGAHVEVEGTLDAQGVLHADKVEFEEQQEQQEVEVKGVITSGNAASFMIGSQAVVTSSATEFRDGSAANIVPGASVEAKGTLDAQGILHADRVKFED